MIIFPLLILYELKNSCLQVQLLYVFLLRIHSFDRNPVTNSWYVADRYTAKVFHSPTGSTVVYGYFIVAFRLRSHVSAITRVFHPTTRREQFGCSVLITIATSLCYYVIL